MSDRSSSPDLKAITNRWALVDPDEDFRLGVSDSRHPGVLLVALHEAPRDIKTLLTQIAELREELQAFKPQPMSQRCRDGHHNGVGDWRCINCRCLCHNQDALVAELQGRVDDLTGQVAGKEATIQRVTGLHREWVLYDEDACTHQDEDHDVFLIAGVGNICADARIKSLCRECCTDDGEFQSRHCVEDHAGTPCWPCPTKLAIDGDPADDGSPR